MTTQNVTRYVRYQVGNEAPRHGIRDGDTIRELDGDLFGNPRQTGKTVPLSQAKLLVPLDPMKVQKVLGIAGNFVPEGGARTVPHGRWFCKAPTSLNAHEGEVECPPDAPNMNYEGELVLVIGRKCKNVSVAEAPSYIWGVTIGNDYSENYWIRHENYTNGQSPLLSKSTDSWATLFTDIVTGIDYSDLHLQVRLNGDVNADGHLSNMIHKPAMLVNYMSHFMTLLPGDVIYCGTVNPQTLPGKRKELKPGDVIEVEIEGIGTLRNRMVPMKGASTNL
jgi:2-keto-4-pentenoate hydratase/2-oxohepta-3-ene-1,7-dioic acid hydratase in catechol pathway